MGVTADGFHFPELTDAPDGPAALLALASDMDALFPVGVGAWNPWTPTVTQATSVSINTTTSLCAYWKVARFVIARLVINITSAGTSGQAITVSTPLTAANGEAARGIWNINDASATTNHIGLVQSSGTAAIAGIENGAAGVMGVAPAFALANGDVIRGIFVMESAT